MFAETTQNLCAMLYIYFSFQTWKYHPFEKKRCSNIKPIILICLKNAVKNWDHLNKNWSNYKILKWYRFFRNTLTKYDASVTTMNQLKLEIRDHRRICSNLQSFLLTCSTRPNEWGPNETQINLSTIRYGSMVKWSNSGNGVASSPIPWCSSYWKGSLQQM